jgi:signal transduction histidine kinase
MSMNNRPASTRSGARPLVVILLLTLGLAGFLTYEAWDAARRHRSSAEQTLREYAAFAAWEFNASLKENLNSTVVWLFGPVRTSEPLWPGEKVAPPSILAASLKPDLRCEAEKEPTTFRVDFGDRRIVTGGPGFSPAFSAWIRDTVIAEIRAGRYWRESHYSAVFGVVGGERRNIMYQVKWDAMSRPVAAYGFEFCMRRFAPATIQKVLLKGQVLPPSVTRGLPNDSIFSVVVRDGQGHELFRSATRYESAFHNTHTLDYLGSLTTEITFRPDVAERLLIGGLPTSRLPLLLTVLAITMVLVVMGILQLRREDELQRLRSDFVASVSHELRTPLAQLRMFAETLLLGRIRTDSERTRSLEIIDQEARRLSHLVENILQFSRAERQALQLKREDQDLAPHVREAVEVFGPVGRARKASVDLVVASGLRARVDAGALRQILLNLLDNAVKYGPVEQHVRVTLSRAGTMARLTVDDEGPGIPVSDRLRIWKAFQRLERDVNSAVAGSGIGLAVVCELVLGHDGKGWVEEAPGGKGARFVIEIPLTATGEGDA